MRKRYYLLFTLVIFGLIYWLVDPKTCIELVYDTFRSLLRMICAYIFSIIFSFSVGLLILHSRKAYSILFPICDVLQGVPVLGFFPFAIYFFIHTFPGGWLGEELASIFLIFTGMTWSILFSVVEAGANMSKELRDLALLLKLDPLRYLFEIFLPLAFPPFVSASITGWGGGWYFLFASEFLTLGHERFALPGLGTFIAQSAFAYNILYSFIGLGVLAWIVLGIDVYVWQPLIFRVRDRWEGVFGIRRFLILDVLDWLYTIFKRIVYKLDFIFNPLLFFLGITPKRLTLCEPDIKNPLLPVVGLLFFWLLFSKCRAYFPKIFLYAALTLLRISIGLLISLVLALSVAILVARNERLSSIVLPILDIGQSLPAVSLFPMIIITVIQTIGGRVGVEVGTILLIITGMIWYLIFRLIRELNNFPPSLDEFARLIQLPAVEKLRHIILPFLFPAIVVGAIQAVGGGWNASIIGEYIVDNHGHVLTSAGLGYLLSYATYKGNIWLSMLAVTGMTLLILVMNAYIWKPLLKKASDMRW